MRYIFTYVYTERQREREREREREIEIERGGLYKEHGKTVLVVIEDSHRKGPQLIETPFKHNAHVILKDYLERQVAQNSRPLYPKVAH